MTWVALSIVLFSALIHASWNFLLKKSGGGSGLIAAATTVSLAIYAPIVAVATWFQGYQFRPIHLALMLGSGAIHTAYFLLLDRAYRSGGELSMVYPLARATGPLITIVVAIFFLGEHPGPAAIGGAVLIGASAVVLTGNPFRYPGRAAARGPRDHHPGQAVAFALLTGLMIASYTVWDKACVSAWLIPPLLYDWGCNLFRVAILIPWARHRASGSIAAAWRERRGTVVAIALLSPLSYILVLTAMVFTPVSLVAPAREVSILFAALMGAHFLREGDLARRAVAATGMVLGISGLALG